QPSEHGYIDLGQGQGASDLTQVIEYGGYPNASSTPSYVTANMWIGDIPGNKATKVQDAVADRSAQDTDQTSTTNPRDRAAGTGNGRRIVTAPVDDPTLATGSGNNGQSWIIGFGNFLLDPSVTINGSSGPICATYIGPANGNGFGSGGSDSTKVYMTILYQ